MNNNPGLYIAEVDLGLNPYFVFLYHVNVYSSITSPTDNAFVLKCCYYTVLIMNLVICWMIIQLFKKSLLGTTTLLGHEV